MMPRPRLLIGCCLAGLPFLLTPWFPAATSAGLTATLSLVAISLLDLWWTPRLQEIEASRNAPEVLSVGARNPVTIQLRNKSSRPMVVLVHDEPPPPQTQDELPLQVTLPAGKLVAVTYATVPHHRGRNQFGTLFLRTTSGWGFWTLQDERPLTYPVRIYPDVQSVRRIELLARRNRLAEAGLRMSRLRGRGSDFDRLREYRRDDESRHIDWKATARQQSLISREYVIERNQNLLLVLDAGRSMCHTLDGISHFDRALNAATLLTYVACRQGDSVGLLAGHRQVTRWVRPVRGRTGTEQLVAQTYDLLPAYELYDAEALARELQLRYRKRSLVIWMTHAIDEQHLQSLTAVLRRQHAAHLVLLALLRNVPLEERLQQQPISDEDALQIGAAAELIEAQRAAWQELESSGLLVIECRPEELSARLISRYLEIKARHLL